MRLDLGCQIQPKSLLFEPDDAANVKYILCFSYAHSVRDEGASGAACESNGVHQTGWEEAWVRELWLGLFFSYSCQAVQSGSTYESCGQT